MKRRALMLCAALAAGDALLAAAEEPVLQSPPPAKLRFDPFEKPARPAKVGPAARTAVEPREQWTPVLRATLIAGEEPLANLSGVVLGLGEETHGYRLVEVQPFGAVFERGGERIELEVQAADAAAEATP